MSQYRRRRSVEPEPPRRGIPLFPLIIVVILAGLLLGGILARMHPSTKTVITQSQMPVITPLPSVARVQNSPTPSPGASPTATPKGSPTPSAQSSPTATPTAASTQTPSPKPSPGTATPQPSPKPTATAVVVFTTPKPTKAPTVAPTATPAPATAAPTQAPSGSERAASLVRSYLAALARGDVATASSYLARGTPSETFMSNGGRVGAVSAHGTDASGYKVTANVATNAGDYFIEFTVQAGGDGYIITDHYAIKV